MRTTAWSIVGCGFLLMGCGNRAPVETPRASAADAGAHSEPTPLAAIYADGGAIAARARRSSVTLTDIQGRTSEELGFLFEPAQEAVEACRKSTGGKLRVRVRSEGGKLAFDVEPGSSLDPTERRCILEALSAIHIEETPTLTQGATVRPTGFTSLVTVEW